MLYTPLVSQNLQRQQAEQQRQEVAEPCKSMVTWVYASNKQAQITDVHLPDYGVKQKRIGLSFDGFWFWNGRVGGRSQSEVKIPFPG